MAGEPTTANLPTYLLNASLVSTRASEVPAASFSDGANKAGSCAGGLGICTGVVDPSTEAWTTLDQDGSARTAVVSGHIGTATSVINAEESGDDNDTLGLAVAIGSVVADAVIANGVVNKTGVTMSVGERAWGPITVV